MKTPYIRNNDEARSGPRLIRAGRSHNTAPFYFGGRLRSAHVYSFILHKGPIPAGHEVDHICRNRGCCNPDHLRPLTHRDNVLSGATVPARNAAKSHCIHGHELTPKNVYVEPRGRRQCRTCIRIRQKMRSQFSASAA